ncbi:DUF1657 domain-containing protein [Bacillus sp. FJAT-50079]|uniref:DUF1657 domain-containing protein n=1 Tax=Bacillus sp. FJAT-50079 TaxID=2833577 RepID=UPI001BC95FD1|nr:DUF1657 domain-containing protein [Bacillus sp. FJAT-50079]MBS4209906.1 DUF1657 domain-containing protein [Bacillus sp. FJAT-50079]
MTVFANVQATMANAKGISAAFSDLALKSTDEATKMIFHECMMEMEPVITDLRARIERMKLEELQYRKS